jgi:hypothetical protein
MATSLPVQVQPVVLADNYCPQSWNSLNLEIMRARWSVDLGSISTFVTGTSAPDEETYPDSIWIKLDAQGAPLRAYNWSPNLAAWISPHPVPASSPELRMWRGTPDALKTYEGDDRSGLAPSTTAGPFWEIVAAVTGRVPIGINSATHVNAPPVDDTLPGMEPGVDARTGEITLTTEHVPVHGHAFAGTFGGTESNDIAMSRGPNTTIAATAMKVIQGEGSSLIDSPTQAILNWYTHDISSAYPPSSRQITSVPTMPPGYGVYYIGRTIRVYYAET